MKRPSKRLQTILAVALLLYACGYLTQFIGNYAVWQKNGGMLGSTSPPFPSLSLLVCLKGILWFPYNLYCMAGCAAVVAALVLYRKLFSQDSLTDSERNFDFSAKGTYGTSGWMQPQEIPAVLDMVSDLSLHTGTVLGMLDSPTQENPTQLNKEIQNKEKPNTDLILSESDAVRKTVKENIELDLLCRNMPEATPMLQEIYELIIETIQSQSPTVRLGSNIFPAELVRERMMQLNSEHIRFVLDSFHARSGNIRNPKKYLLAMLFNAPITLNSKTAIDAQAALKCSKNRQI